LIDFPEASDWLPVHEVWDNQDVWVDEVAIDEKKESLTAPRPGLISRRGRRWLGFELSVLRRLKFSSIAIPFTGRPDLGWHLKCWGKQVITNDICQWSWWMSRALIENSKDSLDIEDVAYILGENGVAEDIDVTGSFPLKTEDEATWFLKVRENIQNLGSEHKRALGYLHALDVADYLLAFTDETEHLRRPLNEVFTALWRNQKPVVDNQQLNLAANQDANDFIGGVRADCMFVRLPRPEGLVAHEQQVTRWRESWVRANESEWDTLVAERCGRLGDSVVSKDHYLELAGSFLEGARHIPKWAIAHDEDGFLSAAEIGELMRQFRRRVEVTYAKDFSGVVGGTHSYIIIAG
jgi:hypothetical protein